MSAEIRRTLHSGRPERPWTQDRRHLPNPLTVIRNGLTSEDPTIRRNTRIGVAILAIPTVVATFFGASIGLEHGVHVTTPDGVVPHPTPATPQPGGA